MNNYSIIGDYVPPWKTENFRSLKREFLFLGQWLERRSDGFLVAMLREEPQQYVIRELRKKGEVYSLRERAIEVAYTHSDKTSHVVFMDGSGPMGGTMRHSDRQLLGRNLMPSDIFLEILKTLALLGGARIRRELKPIFVHYGLRIQEDGVRVSLPDIVATEAPFPT